MNAFSSLIVAVLPFFLSGGVAASAPAKWAQCGACGKWRVLPRNADLGKLRRLPKDGWRCAMNAPPPYANACRLPEDDEKKAAALHKAALEDLQRAKQQEDKKAAKARTKAKASKAAASSSSPSSSSSLSSTSSAIPPSSSSSGTGFFGEDLGEDEGVLAMLERVGSWMPDKPPAGAAAKKKQQEHVVGANGRLAALRAELKGALGRRPRSAYAHFVDFVHATDGGRL